MAYGAGVLLAAQAHTVSSASAFTPGPEHPDLPDGHHRGWDRSKGALLGGVLRWSTSAVHGSVASFWRTVGVLFVLYVLPGGLGALIYRASDAILRASPSVAASGCRASSGRPPPASPVTRRRWRRVDRRSSRPLPAAVPHPTRWPARPAPGWTYGWARRPSTRPTFLRSTSRRQPLLHPGSRRRTPNRSARGARSLCARGTAVRWWCCYRRARRRDGPGRHRRAHPEIRDYFGLDLKMVTIIVSLTGVLTLPSPSGRLPVRPHEPDGADRLRRCASACSAFSGVAPTSSVHCDPGGCRPGPHARPRPPIAAGRLLPPEAPACTPTASWRSR